MYSALYIQGHNNYIMIYLYIQGHNNTVEEHRKHDRVGICLGKLLLEAVAKIPKNQSQWALACPAINLQAMAHYSYSGSV